MNNNNVVCPIDFVPPPSYGSQPKSPRPSFAAPYQQHDDKKQPPTASSNLLSNLSDKCSSGGFAQCPLPAGAGPCGPPMGPPMMAAVPMAAACPLPGYGPPQLPQFPQKQQQQQQVVVINDGQSKTIIVRKPEAFIGQMVLACCVLWCCNCPFGLVAFILAAVASNRAVSDPDCGHKLGIASWSVSVVGLIIAIVVVTVVFVTSA